MTSTICTAGKYVNHYLMPIFDNVHNFDCFYDCYIQIHEDFKFMMLLERREGSDEGTIWKDTVRSCLAGIRTEASTASRTHPFCAHLGISTSRRYDTCFLTSDRRSEFRIKESNPFLISFPNSGMNHVRSL